MRVVYQIWTMCGVLVVRKLETFSMNPTATIKVRLHDFEKILQLIVQNSSVC